MEKNLSYSGDFRIQCLLLLPSQRAVLLMFKTEVISLLSGGILERGGGSGLHRMDDWYLKMLVCRWHPS